MDTQEYMGYQIDSAEWYSGILGMPIESKDILGLQSDSRDGYSGMQRMPNDSGDRYSGIHEQPFLKLVDHDISFIV
ncbi:hypothetical protein J6590_037453 [Homalodisca vitripennis]|nr:hypothetical protein J6590_037453 [Homalodisca vitripennis]